MTRNDLIIFFLLDAFRTLGSPLTTLVRLINSKEIDKDSKSAFAVTFSRPVDLRMRRFAIFQLISAMKRKPLESSHVPIYSLANSFILRFTAIAWAKWIRPLCEGGFTLTKERVTWLHNWSRCTKFCWWRSSSLGFSWDKPTDVWFQRSDLIWSDLEVLSLHKEAQSPFFVTTGLTSKQWVKSNTCSIFRNLAGASFDN